MCVDEALSTASNEVLNITVVYAAKFKYQLYFHFSFTKPVNDTIILKTITAQCLYSVGMGGMHLTSL